MSTAAPDHLLAMCFSRLLWGCHNSIYFWSMGTLLVFKNANKNSSNVWIPFGPRIIKKWKGPKKVYKGQPFAFRKISAYVTQSSQEWCLLFSKIPEIMTSMLPHPFEHHPQNSFSLPTTTHDFTISRASSVCLALSQGLVIQEKARQRARLWVFLIGSKLLRHSFHWGVGIHPLNLNLDEFLTTLTSRVRENWYYVISETKSRRAMQLSPRSWEH